MLVQLGGGGGGWGASPTIVHIMDIFTKVPYAYALEGVERGSLRHLLLLNKPLVSTHDLVYRDLSGISNVTPPPPPTPLSHEHFFCYHNTSIYLDV